MTQCYDLLQQKGVRQNQQREKGHGVNSVGNQAQVSQSPLPMESHSTGFVPPALTLQHMGKCCLLGKLVRDAVPRGFCRGAAHAHTL